MDLNNEAGGGVAVIALNATVESVALDGSKPVEQESGQHQHEDQKDFNMTEQREHERAGGIETEREDYYPQGENRDRDQDEDEDRDEEEEDDDDQEETVTEACTDLELSGARDSEVEHHIVNGSIDLDLTSSAITRDLGLEAAEQALYLRYANLRTEAVSPQHGSADMPFPLPMEDHFQDGQSCENPFCQERQQWQATRITQLQAALDHMTEAMAIQQRDLATERIFVSRQAEQLTQLSIRLHHERLALSIERERLQKLRVASTRSGSGLANMQQLLSATKPLPRRDSARSVSAKLASIANFCVDANRRPEPAPAPAPAPASVSTSGRSASLSEVDHKPLFRRPSAAPSAAPKRPSLPMPTLIPVSVSVSGPASASVSASPSSLAFQFASMRAALTDVTLSPPEAGLGQTRSSIERSAASTSMSVSQSQAPERTESGSSILSVAPTPDAKKPSAAWAERFRKWRT